MTHQAPVYRKMFADFARHDTVDHSKDDYARRDDETIITTNTIESYFSVFKRGMKGTYQHCGEKGCFTEKSSGRKNNSPVTAGISLVRSK
jgi:hypothetical protein